MIWGAKIGAPILGTPHSDNPKMPRAPKRAAGHWEAPRRLLGSVCFTALLAPGAASEAMPYSRPPIDWPSTGSSKPFVTWLYLTAVPKMAGCANSQKIIIEICFLFWCLWSGRMQALGTVRWEFQCSVFEFRWCAFEKLLCLGTFSKICNWKNVQIIQSLPHWCWILATHAHNWRFHQCFVTLGVG